MGDILNVSEKERMFLVEMKLIERKRETITQAAKRLGISYRHCRRLYKRYRKEGDKGVIHRMRGKRSNRCLSAELKEKVIVLYRQEYAGFGPTFVAEKLGEKRWEVSHDTIRRWLTQAGLWERQRKRSPHRQWRTRKEHFGELVQMDGSFHNWLGTGVFYCLMNMVDDATGKTLGLLFDQETTEAAMRTLWAWIKKYGVPAALYTDRKNVYITEREPTVEEQLRGQMPLTAFGKACQKLGIRIVTAHSPQAKGRVERSNGVYQDRFVKELRLRGIRTRKKANTFLEKHFCPALNEKFERVAASEVDFHRPVPKGLCLENVFVMEELRQVHHDTTFRYQNQVYAIIGPRRALPPARAHVRVQEGLDGSLHIFYRDCELSAVAVNLPPKKIDLKEKRIVFKRPHPPAADHPWKRPYKGNRLKSTLE